MKRLSNGGLKKFFKKLGKEGKKVNDSQGERALCVKARRKVCPIELERTSLQERRKDKIGATLF